MKNISNRRLAWRWKRPNRRPNKRRRPRGRKKNKPKRRPGQKGRGQSGGNKPGCSAAKRKLCCKRVNKPDFHNYCQSRGCSTTQCVSRTRSIDGRCGGSCSAPAYDSASSYNSGDLVERMCDVYKCKGFPHALWCSNQDYAPGTIAGEAAWDKIDSC